jgi:hypothetical protein
LLLKLSISIAKCAKQVYICWNPTGTDVFIKSVL